MLKRTLILSIIVSLLTACGTGTSSNNNNHVTPDVITSPYLSKPTGQYGVGYQDMHFQDNTRCPDVFYKPNINEADFSPENTQYCREIMIRVYYPTNNQIALGDSYYAPLIQELKNRVSDAPSVKPDDVKELDNLKSYSLANATPISNKKFPIVLFSHGGGGSVQGYENEITNLVSHGYVVVGVNSFFVGSYIALPNGHIVHADKHVSDADSLNSMQSDIMFTYDTLHKIINEIHMTENVDCANIGIFGHSFGARALANLIHSNNPKYIFKAASALDEGIIIDDIHDKAVTIDGFDIPFLHEISGQVFYRINSAGASLQFNLNTNNYLVGLAPDEKTIHQATPPFYTTHPEFSDEGTLKEMPVIQLWLKDVQDATGSTPYGTAHGDYIANATNTNLVVFFDYYLKDNGQGNNPFANCNPLVKNTIMKCGPVIYK